MKYLLFFVMGLSAICGFAQDLVKGITLDDKGSLNSYKLNDKGYFVFDFSKDGRGALDESVKYFYDADKYNLVDKEFNVMLYVNILRDEKGNIKNFKEIIQKKEKFYNQKQPNTDFIYAITDGKGFFKRFNFENFPLPFMTKSGYSTNTNFTSLNENSYSTVFEFMDNSKVYKKETPYLFRVNTKTGNYSLKELKFIDDKNSYNKLFSVSDKMYTVLNKVELNSKRVKIRLLSSDFSYLQIDSITFLNKIKSPKLRFLTYNDLIRKIKKKDREWSKKYVEEQSGKVKFNPIDSSYYCYGKVLDKESNSSGFYLNKFNKEGTLLWSNEKIIFEDKGKHSFLMDLNNPFLYILNTQKKSLPLIIIDSLDEKGFLKVYTFNDSKGNELLFQQYTKQKSKGDFKNGIRSMNATLDFTQKIENSINSSHSKIKELPKNLIVDLNTLIAYSHFESFKTYIDNKKGYSNELNIKTYFHKTGIVVLQADNKAKDYKLMRFNW